MEQRDNAYKDLSNNASLWILATVVILFIILHLLMLSPSISDENTYFYMGNLIANGFTPYKDFFYAHPPLNILIIALLIKLFGLNLVVLKFVPIITTALSAIFIYLLLKTANSRLSGIIAVILFLFSYGTLRVSTYLTGIDISVLFLMIGLYFLFREKKRKRLYLVSGILLAIAALSALFSLVAAFIILVILSLKNKRNAIYSLIGFLSIFLTVNLILILLYGQSYITSVIKYHFLKPETSSSFTTISTIVKDNWLIFLAAGLFIFAKERKKVSVLVIISLAYFLFLLTYKSLFSYYIFIILPLLAIIGSYSIFSIADRINNIKLSRILFVAIFVLIGISSLLSSSRYLNYKFQNFNTANEIADYIIENTNSERTLFGDDSITPLLALMSERKIAFNYADLNNFRWRTGLVDIHQTIKEIKAEKPLIITFQVNVPQGTFRYGIDYLDEFHYFLDEECTVIKEFKDTWLDYEKVVRLWDC